MRYLLIIIFFILGCGGGGGGVKNAPVQNTSHQTVSEAENSYKNSEDYIEPHKVDKKTYDLLRFDINATKDECYGNWYGEYDHMKIALLLKKDGTYEYKSVLLIGKYHNVPRVSEYKGTWVIANSNSQIKLKIQNCDAPLVLSNRFPVIKTPAGVNLYPGSCVDENKTYDINGSYDKVEAKYTTNAQKYMERNVSDYSVDYFTMVAAKANSESFWKSVDMLPPGFNYGHKFDTSADWDYAKKRMAQDSENYAIVISDESWQNMMGNRGVYKKTILKSQKIYRWLEYFKDQMQILGKVKGPVIYIFAGDAPAYFAGDIRSNFGNDPKNVPAKLIESRFPEVLERNPDNSFAGIFQTMDYLRMKYAPNVKLAYTLKTWGIAEKDIYHEPSGGWDNYETVKTMADYLNNFGVQFDLLSFNFHPRSSHTTEEYESAAKYFGAISKHLKMRDNNKPKLWIWKLSLWNQEQTSFIFSHIDYLVDKCNAIGVTLGHGNDLAGKSGFVDNEDDDNYLKSWIIEYFKGEQNDSIPIHAVKGLIYWR